MMNEPSVLSNSCCLVATTIGAGEFLPGYWRAIKREHALDKVTVIVIPDRKTPRSLFRQCQSYAQQGLRIECPTLEEQNKYLARLGLKDLIPYDSDNRRNVGFLMALESGHDFMISIDDDNYCRERDAFFCEHAVVCTGDSEAIAVHSSNGWFNICDLMQVKPDNVYPRGFPYKYRHQQPEIRRSKETGFVRLNAGLWLLDPDLDAMTWLVNPARADRFYGESVLLGQDTWSPVNTQNTAMHRDLIVAYYFVRMGYPIGGLRIDRYGDILSGYFCQACARYLGHRIRVGSPTVDHRRNTHNFMRDATNELGCIWLVEDLVDWLRDSTLQGNTYDETYVCLAESLDEAAERFTGFIWTEATRGYLHRLAHLMRRWVAACRLLI